jgi:hypothetical protein
MRALLFSPPFLFLRARKFFLRESRSMYGQRFGIARKKSVFARLGAGSGGIGVRADERAPDVARRR